MAVDVVYDSEETVPAVLSLNPEELPYAARYDRGVELTLDWEHEDLFKGAVALEDVLDEADVAPEQVLSVHLPPGVSNRGNRYGMAASWENVDAITDFVYDQLDAVPDATLVTHPPKKMPYSDQVELLRTLSDVTDRDISVENTTGRSYWRTPEDLAFFGFLQESGIGLEDVYLTIDSTHLPATTGLQPTGLTGETDGLYEAMLDRDAITEIADRVRDEDVLDRYNLSEETFVDYLGDQLTEQVDAYAEHAPKERLQASETGGYWPMVRTMLQTGDRVYNIHFNDPQTDGMPDVHRDRHDTGLQTAAALAGQNDAYPVLHPRRDALDDSGGLRADIDTLESMMEEYGT